MVEVPVEDRDALAALCAEIGAEPPHLVRGLTGEAVIQAVVVVGVAALGVLQRWLVARAGRRTRFVLHGNAMEFENYSRDDVVALLRVLGADDPDAVDSLELPELPEQS